ncbi:MAG: hypothetical protein JST92_06410, partial [Deltaproteobacteria bacterium]|nr:hypothetical protein [Deltaproteobacteria bacterium]
MRALRLAIVGFVLGSVACAGGPVVRADRVRFAQRSSALLVTSEGSTVRVLGVPDLRAQWSRAYPVEKNKPLLAELSASGRYVLVRSDEHLWLTDRADPGGPRDVLTLAQRLDPEAFTDDPVSASAVAAISPDEQWFARVDDRALSLYALPEARRVSIPAELAAYPACADGSTSCGVTEVSFSADSAWILVKHRPDAESRRALLGRLKAPFDVHHVPLPGSREGQRATFFGGTGEVLFARWNLLRLFGPDGERALPGELDVDACPGPLSVYSAMFPTALCISGTGNVFDVTLRDLAAGRVLASFDSKDLTTLAQGPLAARAMGKDRAVLVYAKDGTVLTLGGKEPKRAFSLGRRAPDLREAPDAPLLP